MSAVTTLAATIAAAAGAVAAFRFIDRRTRPLREALRENAGTANNKPTLDYERDPDSGVFKPKDR